MTLVFLCAVTLVFGVAGMAEATPYTFDIGANSSVDTSGTNNVLQMYANVNPNLDNEIFSLEEGESSTFYFAELGTTEGWINIDDLFPGNLTAYVDFDNPDLIEEIAGTSIGFCAWFKFFQGWNLTWDDPVVVDFGTGGQFTIELSDVGYGSWFWQGPDGSADVYATITLNSAPVPEPTTILLLATGLAGMGVFGRKKFIKQK